MIFDIKQCRLIDKSVDYCFEQLMRRIPIANEETILTEFQKITYIHSLGEYRTEVLIAKAKAKEIELIDSLNYVISEVDDLIEKITAK